MQQSIMKKFIKLVKENNEKNLSDKLSIKCFNNISTVINYNKERIYQNYIYAYIKLTIHNS